MLHASEERYKRASSRRTSALAKGVEVLVSSGECIGETTTVLDADYITNRVLVLLPNKATPQWLSFSQVVAPSNIKPSQDS